MKKFILAATLIAGSLATTAQAQSDIVVRRGDASAAVEAQTGMQYHLTVGNGNPKTDVTFYSNSFDSLFAMYQMLMLFVK